MKHFRLLSAIIMLFVFSTANAIDEKISVSVGDKDGGRLIVSPGDVADGYIFIDVASDADFTLEASITINCKLPEGIELVGKPALVEGSFACPVSSETVTVDGDDWYFTNTSDEYYNNKSLLIKKGAIVTFQIKASESLAASEIPLEGNFYAFYIKSTNKKEHFIVDDYEDEVQSFNIYVEEAAAETEKITLTKKYNTYVPAKALDFSSVEGLTAYYVTAVTATEATLTPATTVAAGEGIILEGTAGTEYDVPVATAEVAKNSANLLATGTIAEGDYILYDGQFVLCTGGTLPDGKAYLPKSAISTSSAKALILGFGDATGINEAKAAKADGAIYSISGVRVAQPQKGVYIMNGRKVIVK